MHTLCKPRTTAVAGGWMLSYESHTFCHLHCQAALQRLGVAVRFLQSLAAPFDQCIALFGFFQFSQEAISLAQMENFQEKNRSDYLYHGKVTPR